MESVTGWWFAPADNRLANDDGREIAVGITHTIDGDVIPCEKGLHLSVRAIDALKYAPGPIIYRVRGSGIIVPHGNPVDKFACSTRAYIAGGVDSSDVLDKFARMCALDVIKLWSAPQVVIDYLKTGDHRIMAAAKAVAGNKAMVMAWGMAKFAVLSAEWAAALLGATTAWHAVRFAAKAVAWSEVSNTVDNAARDLDWSKAWVAENKKQNKRLTKMLTRLVRAANGKRRHHA